MGTNQNELERVSISSFLACFLAISLFFVSTMKGASEIFRQQRSGLTCQFQEEHTKTVANAGWPMHNCGRIWPFMNQQQLGI
jgi:hypothetical protein